MQGAQEEKKQFVVPKREDLIDDIKCLDDDIEHVSLNLIKCDFNAVEKDVEKAFPDYQLVKVKKYNPGSFEVIFETKIDAINFIKKEFDKKILTRRFFIKMGRQHKEHAEDWTAIGHVPRQFRQGPKRNFQNNKDKKEEGETHAEGQQQQEHKSGEHEEHKPVHREQREHREHREHRQHREHKPRPEHHHPEHKNENKHPEQAKVEPKSEPKAEDKPAVEAPKPAEHKEGKVIPKFQHKPRQDRKPREPRHEGKQEGKQEGQKQDQKANQAKPATEKKQEQSDIKVERKPEIKPETKKETQEEKPQDDGWIVVPTAKKNKSKR